MIFKQERVIWHLKSSSDDRTSGPDRDLAATVPADESDKTRLPPSVSAQEEPVLKKPGNMPLADEIKLAQDNLSSAKEILGGTEPERVDFNRWERLPYRLRKKRADLFISSAGSVDFVGGLLRFLEGKGFKILPYDDTVHYLPYDVLLLSAKERSDTGIVMNLEAGREAVWAFLKAQFGERLSK